MNPSTEATYVASLYVGDLKPEVSDQMLWTVFSGFGQVLSVKICKDSTTSASLGYAYVNFRTTEEAEKAMNALNYTHIEGKPCRIMWSMRDSQKRRNNVGNLILKNIDPSIDSRALYEAFSVFGPIMSCKLVTDANGKSKGFGFIQFCNEKDADGALEKANGIEFLNKKILVSRFLTKAQRLGDNADGKPKFTNVFCKNFADEWTASDLETIFGKFGAITSCVVMNDSNGKSRGFGFVNFEKPESAEKAVSDLAELKTPLGKSVYVARAMKKAERVEILRRDYIKRKQDNIRKCQNLNIYVKPLDPEMTEEKLKEHFEKFGTIISHRIMKEPTGKSRGFGFVCYSTPEEAQRAIQEMNNKVIETRPLLVTLAQSKEDRRKELMAQHLSRAGSSSVYQQAPFPLVYPQNAQFNQSYPNVQQQRYPQFQMNQKSYQRGVAPMNPQFIQNSQRGYPSMQYTYQNQYVPRPGRHVPGSQLGPSQTRPGPTQSRGYQQYTQGPPYQQHMQDSQNFRLQNSQVPPALQTTVNYVATTTNVEDLKSTNQENTGLSDQSSPFMQLSEEERKSIIDKIVHAVSELCPGANPEFVSRVLNVVVDAIVKNIKISYTDKYLMEAVTHAVNFIQAHDTKVASESVPTPTALPSA